MVVTLLSRERLGKYYRFFGARHSILQVGYLIDFEVESQGGSYLPRLRNVSHIGFPWLFERDRLLAWQRYIQKFELHLRDTETLEGFYLDSLLEAARRWHKQHPKRVALWHYTQLLHFEGRLYPPTVCYLCEKPLGGYVSMMVGLKGCHPHCLHAPKFPIQSITSLLYDSTTLYLDDNDVSVLFELILKGI